MNGSNDDKKTSNDKLKELISFSRSLRLITDISEKTTNTFVQSIDYIENQINTCHTGIADIFSLIELRKMRIENMNMTVNELDVFLKLIDVIDNDKLNIMQGHRGLLKEYIQNLEYINTIIEKYEWLKDLIYVSPASSTAGSSSLVTNVLMKKSHKISNFQAYYNKYVVLVRHGESLLSQEFYDVLQHYSNFENMRNFIDFLISKKDEIDGELSNEDYALFIPKETIIKLEQICWWFLRREQQYELYDDKNQHCDIIKKLKYNEKRNGYLKICLITYSKMNSLDFKKDPHDKLKKINKLYHAAISDSHNKSKDDSGMNEAKLKEFFNNMQHQSFDEVGGEDTSSKSSSKNPSKPVDYIEVFADNLDFSLKLLKHENVLIRSIFCKSEETCVELISILTILIMDQIKEEFERFFKNSCEFSKVSNNGEEVVEAIIRLIIKVFNLKEKTTCLQTKDLSSASKLLQFSMRLNEIGSQIFYTYLDVIESGNYNTYDICYNCSIHEYLIKVCNVMRFINENEKYLVDSIKLTSNTLLTESTKKDKKDKHNNDNEDKNSQSNDQEDIDDIDPMELYQRSARGGGRKQNLAMQDLNEIQEMKSSLSKDDDEEEEDFIKSSKSHFARFYSNFIERSIKFLNQEATKSTSSNQPLLYSNSSMSASTTSLTSFALSNNTSMSNNFISHVKTLKSNIFLINNENYLIDFIDNDVKIKENIIKLNPSHSLINTIKDNINNYIEKSFDLFKYIQSKWAKALAEGLYSNITTSNDVFNESSFDNNENEPNEIDKSSNPKLNRRSFKYGFMDSKRKRKEEFLRIIKECIDVCAKIVILNQNTCNLFKEKVKNALNPIFQTLESNGDLGEIALALNVRYEKSNISDLLFNKMFPLT